MKTSDSSTALIISFTWQSSVCTVCFLKLNVLMELSLRHVEGISLNIDLALVFLIIFMLRFAIITWYLQISQTTLFL